MNLVWKLLRRHISIVQFIGFSVANLIGILIILAGVQFYSDVRPLFSQADHFMKKEYLILSKKVSTLGALVGRSSTFSEKEILDFSRQPFGRDIGVFTSCRYGVTATISLLGQHVDLSTQLFFESVPDRFLDVQTDQWSFDPAKDEVPIILPKNYLDLYNFGFAQSRNLPQLSAGVLGLIQIDLQLRGNGYVKNLKGRIVGFSSRLNTILVPESFMQWSNELFSEADRDQRPSRLIVAVDNPVDESLVLYLQKNGYETEGNGQDTGKLGYLLKLLVLSVSAVGLVIMLLSLFILMLSIYLLLQKNSDKLRTLLLLGYLPHRVAFPYQLLATGLNLGGFGIAFVVLVSIRTQYFPMLQQLYPTLPDGSLVFAAFTGILLSLFFSVVNSRIIYQKLRSLMRDR